MITNNYQVFATDTFKEIFETLDGAEQQWITKIKHSVEESEYPTGKILHFTWFREKKYLNKRLFFLIDEASKKILFVSFTSKKEQQGVIDLVIQNKEALLNNLRNLK